MKDPTHSFDQSQAMDEIKKDPTVFGDGSNLEYWGCVSIES
jgi:hypothetical protein